MTILAPSILAADFWKLGEQIREVEKAGVKYLHIDVMDGIFVPAISYGMPIIASIREKTSLFFDVHLMIDKPERYVETFAELGADLLNFHLEATDNAAGVIEQIRRTGKKVGITIKPGTPVSALEPYLELVDMVLVMTVEPGFGGQVWMPECLDKVREVRRIVTEKNLKTDIEVDGGINFDNIHSAVDAGANIVVSGTSVFKNDIGVNIERLMRNAGKKE